MGEGNLMPHTAHLSYLNALLNPRQLPLPFVAWPGPRRITTPRRCVAPFDPWLQAPLATRRRQGSSLGPLLGLAVVGGLAFMLVEELSRSPRRPHIEGWKRDYVFERDGGKCTYCRIRVTRSTCHMDHKNPIVLGGSNELRNLALSCAPCNLEKGALTAREFRRFFF